MTTSFAEAPGGGPDIERSVNVNLNADVSGFTQGVQDATAQVNALAAAMGNASHQANSLMKAAGTKIMHFGVGDFAVLSGAVATAARFEHQLGTLNATAAITGSSMNAMKQQISGVFSQFPVWREQVVQLATAISNMAVTRPADIGTLTKSYTKLGAATGENSTSLASGGIQLAREMGTMDAGRIDKYNNSLVTLSKTAGVSAQAITDFAGALAPFARAAGIGEAAVLGISAAFQKAGADGQVAANAFSSILASLTQLKSTGGDMSKYSSFVGMTQQQFKGLSTQEEALRTFEQIGKGGARAQAFTQDLGGIRTQTAIQRIGQSGGLRSLIDTSVSSATNTGNLDKGSAAAFAGLTNSMTTLRNEFTTLATAIGDPLIGVINDVVKALGSFMHGINGVLHLLGPLPGLALGAAGVAAVPAAFGLAHAGLSTLLGTGRMIGGKDAGWRAAYGEGRDIARNIRGGMTEAEAYAASPMYTLMQKGELPKHAEFAMKTGMGLTPTIDRLAQTPLAMKIKDATETARTKGFDYAGRGAVWLAEANNEPFDEANLPYAQRRGFRAARGEDVTPSGGRVKRFFRAGIQFPFKSTAALAEAGAAAVDYTAGKLPSTGLGGVAAQEAARAGSFGLRSAGMFSRGIGSAVAGAVTNPALMIGGMVAAPLIGGYIQKQKDENAKQYDVAGSMTGAQSYDQALDQTSTNLAKFGSEVSNATDTLSRFANLPIKGLTQITGQDVSAVMSSDYKVSDQSLSDIVKSGADKPTILSYLNSQGLQAGDVGGDRFKKYARDLLSAKGVGSAGDVSDIMSSFADTLTSPGGISATPNFDLLATAAKGSGSYKSFMGPAIAGEIAGTQGAGDAGTKVSLSNIVRMGGKSLVGDVASDKDNKTAYAAMLQQVYGIDPKEFLGQLEKGSRALGTGGSVYDSKGHLANTLFKNEDSSDQLIAYAIAHTKAGGELIGREGYTGESLGKSAQGLLPLPPITAASDLDITALAGQGTLGRRLAGTTAIRTANQNPSAPGSQQIGANAMLASAMQGAAWAPKGAGTGVGFMAGNDLRSLAATASGPIKDMALAAAAAADNLNDIAKVNMTPTQQASQAISEAGVARQAMAAHPENAELATASGAADVSAIQATQGVTTDVRAKTQAAHDFNKQMARADQDYATQKAWSDQAYQTQSERSTQAYGLQVTRMTRDFGIQQARTDHQFYVQRERETEEFGISQARSTQQYELSITREVAAAALQQARAQQQYDTSVSREKQSHALELSRQTEQFHRQQAREQEDYQIQTERSNAEYQLSMARMNEDYQTQVARSERDFHIQRARELENYHISSSRATRDFNISQQRSAQQFALQLKREAEQAAQNIYDPWSRIQRKATSSAGNLLRNLTQANSSIARQIAELAEAKKLGVSEQTIQQLDLSNPANAQELDTLIKTLKRNPNQVSQINAQIATRVSSTKTLTQSKDNLGYQNQIEDYNTQAKNALDDFNKSQKDAFDDMTRSMKQGYDDFVTHAQDALKDEEKQVARAATDHKTQMHNSSVDFHRNALHEDQDFRTSVLQGWQDLAISLAQGLQDFKVQTQQAQQDLAISLKNQAIDFQTQMTNAVDDFKRHMAQEKIDFDTARDNAAADEKKTLGDMQTDFGITMANAATDHATALSQMTQQYQQAQARAGEDLKDTFHTYTGGLNDAIIQMTGEATDKMKLYAPAAAKEYLQAISDAVTVANAAIDVPGSSAATGGGTVPTAPTNPYPSGAGSEVGGNPAVPVTPGGPSGHAHYAEGGISLNAQMALVSEAGPELHLPLNQQGQTFMTKLFVVAMADAGKQIVRASAAAPKPPPKPPPGIAGSQFAAPNMSPNKTEFTVMFHELEKSIQDGQRQQAEFEAKLAKQAMQQQIALHSADAKAARSNDRNSDTFLAALITRSLAHEVTRLIQAEGDIAEKVIRNEQDNSMSFAGATIKVMANDPNAMAKALAAKAKLARLTSPVKH